MPGRTRICALAVEPGCVGGPTTGPVLGGVDAVVPVLDSLELLLDADEHAGSTAIPKTTSEAASFWLIPATQSIPAHRFSTLDTFSRSQGD
jgi:hypothetical protein